MRTGNLEGSMFTRPLPRMDGLIIRSLDGAAVVRVLSGGSLVIPGEAVVCLYPDSEAFYWIGKEVSWNIGVPIQKSIMDIQSNSRTMRAEL